MTEAFDFSEPIEPTEWLVKGLIPKNTLHLILAKSGVGKSFFVEYLAICLIYGYPFLGKKTKRSKVLIVDQDTPTNVLQNRLKKFERAVSTLSKVRKPKSLFLKSMGDYTLKSFSKLRSVYDDVGVVIIDSLHSLSGDLNLNSVTDMNKIGNLKKLLGDKTVILIHHISDKCEDTLDDMMRKDVNHLGMGSSAINQKSDGIVILGSKAKGKKLNTLYVRASSRRVLLDEVPFKIRLRETDDKMRFTLNGPYKQPVRIFSVDKDIRLLLKTNPDLSVLEIFQGHHQKYSKKVIRTSLERLVGKGAVIEERHSARIFTYRLKPKKRKKRL